MRQVLINAIMTGNVMMFYNSREWRAKRSAILKRDNNECQHCKTAGSYHAAEEVHHIKHLRHEPSLALIDNNLISLCIACHNVQHPEKLHQQEAKGFVNQEKW